MTWTYAELKSAISELTPMPATPDLVVDTLNAQTKIVPADTSRGDIFKIIVGTGEAYKLQTESEKLPTGGAEDVVIGAAWSFNKTLDLFNSIETSNPTTAAIVSGVLNVLNQAGILSAASVADIIALQSRTVPVWSPKITLQDLDIANMASVTKTATNLIDIPGCPVGSLLIYDDGRYLMQGGTLWFNSYIVEGDPLRFRVSGG